MWAWAANPAGGGNLRVSLRTLSMGEAGEDMTTPATAGRGQDKARGHKLPACGPSGVAPGPWRGSRGGRSVPHAPREEKTRPGGRRDPKPGQLVATDRGPDTGDLIGPPVPDSPPPSRSGPRRGPSS